MIVDIHTHFIPRDCFDMVDAAGRTFGPTVALDDQGREVVVADGVSLGPVLDVLTDMHARIDDMDRLSVDMHVMSINPSSLFHGLETEAAIALYRRYNDRMAEAVELYPDRLVGLATLPVQDVDAAISELDRAVKELHLGGIQLGSNIHGQNLDERRLWPLYQRLTDLDVPVLLHPYYVAAPERMSRYWLINLIGNPFDSTIAVGSLIFGGVLEDFPDLRIVVAHGGGAAPYIAGRWQRGYEAFDACRSIPKSPLTYLRQLYFDSLAHSAPSRALLVDVASADHVMLGSDYPFSMGDSDPVRTIRTCSHLSASDKKQILDRTGMAFLKIS
jgi:aminocarboxymuconate-semialdehyde decarboxylase